MYRVQLSGGQYRPNEEVGLHYQIHRGIGVHHAAAVKRGEPLKVNIFVGGTPAMMVAAVMPLPEGMPRNFVCRCAGAAADCAGQFRRGADAAADLRRGGFLHHRHDRSEADVARGAVWRSLGLLQFGTSNFPVLRVDRVYHRTGAIWPFTVVGRPPQEDTVFGQLIHELTGPIIPTVISGVRAVHAVDAAGVHPLLLAIGSERYTPFAETGRPQELLTQANAILGQGQLSLAKYLLIVNGDDDPQLDIHNIEQFFMHLLATGRLAARFAFSNLHDDRYAGLFGRRAERRFQSCDRRRWTAAA